MKSEVSLNIIFNQNSASTIDKELYKKTSTVNLANIEMMDY